MKTYPLFRVHVPTESALLEIGTVFDSEFINEGKQVTVLAGMLSEYLGATNLVLTNSCTSALFMALKLAGVGPGDEVISTPMTCVATNAAIAMTGAKIVWADVEPVHGMLNPDSVAAKITDKTKAVMAVAWAGTPPDLTRLHIPCVSGGRHIKLILDAAHAFDAGYKDQPIHAWVDFCAYSFQAIKHFTTGDGGALVCTDPADHQRAKAMKWFGLDRDRAKDANGNWKGQQWDADIEEIGYKFNMNNVSAAIGISQFEHIDHIMGKHRCNGTLYDDLFRDCKAIRPAIRPPGSLSSHWVYTVLLNELSRLSRDELLKTLNAEGIMAGVVHVPNDDYTCFQSIKVHLPGVRRFAAIQLSLPCGWWLEEDDVRHIAQRVKELTK